MPESRRDIAHWLNAATLSSMFQRGYLPGVLLYLGLSARGTVVLGVICQGYCCTWGYLPGVLLYLGLSARGTVVLWVICQGYCCTRQPPGGEDGQLSLMLFAVCSNT